jgi:plastocyanin
MRPVRHALALVLLVTGVLAWAEPAAPREPRGATEIVRVRIVDFRFRPVTVTIERGTVVKWKNRGDVSHTSTSDTGLWDSGTLSPGEAFRRRFRRAGTFTYHCEIHPSMEATVVVT